MASMAKLEKEFDVEVDWRGFELHPETPKGGIDKRKIFSPARAEEMTKRIDSFAASFGIHGMKTSEKLQNTRSVLAVAEYARDKGKLTIFRNLSMEAYWMHGKDLEDKQVLFDLAKASGIDPVEAVSASESAKYLDRVDTMRAEANGMGVNGIPTFLIGDECIVGCQPYEVLVKAVVRAGGVRRNEHN